MRIPNIRFIKKVLEEYIEVHENIKTENDLWESLRAQKELENLDAIIDLKHLGGEHLGVIRNWIQRKFKNGDSVTWGNDTDYLSGDFSVRDYEQLAIDIAEAVLKEWLKK